MAIYSINDLEKLSGIKAHTIRMWEQRYGIIQPKRTDTNIRYYEDFDLRKLLNIAILNKNGIKISKIAQMSKDEIQNQLAEFSFLNHDIVEQIDALAMAILELEEYNFNKIIEVHFEQTGIEETILNIIFPLVEKLSILWITGSISPAQEVFLTNLVKQKLLSAINEISTNFDSGGKKFLLYLPQGEKQEISLLFMQYLVKKRGHQTIYLGDQLSFADILDLKKIVKPDYIFTIITETLQSDLANYLHTLRENFTSSKILLTGYQPLSQGIEEDGQLTIFKKLQDVIDFLDTISKR